MKKAIQGCCVRPKKGKGTRKAKAVPVIQAPVVAHPKLPYTACFERLVESQNKTTYSHWTSHYRDKRDWATRVGIRMRELRGLRLEWSRWKIERLYKSPRRELDFANLVGGAKPLVDCLIDHDIIVDDRPKHFECAYDQYPSDHNVTIVTLLDYAEL